MTILADITHDSITAYITVSSKGLMASDSNGDIMANRPITVSDIDEDGKFTFHEALIAAHEAYNTSNGYTAGNGSGVSVTEIWGIDSYNNLFFINDKGLLDGVGVDTVSEGDELVVSINKDNEYYSDWYTFFNEKEMEVFENEEFSLTLSGFWGMAYEGDDLIPVPLESISVGSWENGEFFAFEEKITDENGSVTLSFEHAGTYYVSADGTVTDMVTDWWTMSEIEHDCPIIAPFCKVNVIARKAPESLTVTHNVKNVIDDVIIVKKGDKFNLTAYDENGDETPVTWSKQSYMNGVNVNSETGEVEIVSDIYSSGTSYWYFTATSCLDENVSKEVTVKAGGYMLSEYHKTQSVALSADGQTAKTASLSAGKDGHNIWSWSIPEGVAELVSTPENSGQIKFNVFRPGVIEISFKLDINEELTDSGTITVTGVGVEDDKGNRGKTYMGISSESPNPTLQLSAYTAEGKSVSSWSSADESVATVDENGLVTAIGIGSVIITATDNEGATGGIKVVCKSEETPYFENLQFLSTAINDYNASYIFSPTVTEYAIGIKSYSTTKLTLQNTTLFDTERYAAKAEYTDIDGVPQIVPVNSGAVTYLDGIPFENSVIKITLSDKENADNSTVYTFNVTRPRDTTKTIKSNGITLIPDGRNLLSSKYNGYSEGTMFKLLEDGGFKTGWGSSLDTGIYATHYLYKCFVLDSLEKFSLEINGSTVYEHIRYTLDGENYKELAQGGGKTDNIEITDGQSVNVTVQIIDDKTYTDNIKAGKNGFADCEPGEYKLIVEQVPSSSKDAQILTATTDSGDWYPCSFNVQKFTYSIVVPKDTNEKVLTYTVTDGATVMLGETEQTSSDGVYKLTLTTNQQSLTVISADGKVTNTYNFKIQKKSDGYPDKIVDFLCINSQYTNGVGAGNAASPWVSLSGNPVSLGNFGGYITYYYNEPITDNPNNKYGIDFYVYGNANKDTSTPTKTGFFEPAQAWVSEDGESWYALAGSAHYENGVIWDYTVTYEKSDSGKTAWTDSVGNTNDGTSYCGTYPNSDVYTLNELVKGEKIELSGIVLPARNGKIAVSGEAIDSYPVKWGYADCFVNGTKGNDVNPYTDNSGFDLQTNGFDLKWAVDENGFPVDVSEKEFHYIKLVTASNIWHSSFGEKSPEISGVVKTTAQSDAVGITDAPESFTISDGTDAITVNITNTQQVYDIDIGNIKYASISVNGASENDNIYVNNTRIAHNESAGGFKITKENGKRLVRVIVQNGDKEPLVYLLKISGTATESDELIENIKLNVNGQSRTANTQDGKTYTSSVGYRINSVGIHPVAAEGIEITVNGENAKEEYTLETGLNTFVIVGKKDGISHTVTLRITKEDIPSSSGKITVYFTLLGDEKHGDGNEVHTLKNGGLTTWISKKDIEIDSPATVLDVFEKALEGTHSFINADGNYISEIDNLAEFDNGALSGWMYTLNGTHTTKGVAEQSVKNGDSIIFHYTDDYTAEKTSEQWASSAAVNTPVYKVTFNSNGGSDVETQRIEKYDKASEPQPPVKDGFEFAGWFTDEELTEEYNFNSEVTKSITLHAKWQEIVKGPSFTDIPEDSWYADAVSYVVKNGLFNGISETEFAPESTMTRAMLVTVLCRLDKAELSHGENKFTDVPEQEWYTDAVIWAAKNGIVNGISKTEFAPDSSITREQLATILYRYAKMKNYSTTNSANLSNFDDTDEISDWALDAMKWATHAELIKGISETEISPKGFATRAQVATILMRFCESNVK